MMGERLGKWILSSEIGRGGMGRVYLAQEDLTGRQAAVKILAADLAQDVGFLTRFQREIETLSQLSHPHIVQFYDSGQEHGHYFYAMEYVAGQSLEEILETQTRLGWREVLEIALQILPALKHVHDHGIIHRDLKLSNLLVRDDGIIKLTDFGIAKVFATSHLTQTGGVVGTAEYLSPEQTMGKPVTKRSDIYSLGVVFYYLMAGRLPFQGTGFLELMHKHRYAQFDRVAKIVPEIPYEVDEVIFQMMEKDPAKRPPDCLVLAKQIESIRKKLERKDQATRVGPEETMAETKAIFDPQTSPGKSSRGGLLDGGERHDSGGLIGAIFNNPWVLITLLALCLGTIGYAFWPLDEDTLYRKGSELMVSNRLSDLETAWNEYLEPLSRRFPGHRHQEEVERFKQKLASARNPNPGEAQRFLALGDKRYEDGDAAGAVLIWQNVIAAFADVETEEDGVRQARKRLADALSPKTQTEKLNRVRPALEQASKFRADGKLAEADTIWNALESLFRNDPAGAAVLEEITRARKR